MNMCHPLEMILNQGLKIRQLTQVSSILRHFHLKQQVQVIHNNKQILPQDKQPPKLLNSKEMHKPNIKETEVIHILENLIVSLNLQIYNNSNLNNHSIPLNQY